MLQPIAISALVDNLKVLQQQPPHCLILQSYGTGNMAVNAEVIALIQALQAQQCAVILTTQVHFWWHAATLCDQPVVTGQ